MYAVVALALPAVEAFGLAIPAQVFAVSNITPLLDRNQPFASDPGARQGMPRLPFIPNLNLCIVTCIDCRITPAVEEVPQNVHVSAHVYDVGTGVGTTIVDAKGRK